MSEQKTGKLSAGDALRAFGESFKEASRKRAILCAHRKDAAEAGFPIKPQDSEDKKLTRLKAEIEGTWAKSLDELREEFKEFKIPNFSKIVKKDDKGKIIHNQEFIRDYELALAFTPVEEEGVRDFRQAKELEIKIVSGRVSITTNMQKSHERFNYDPQRLFLAMLAEIKDWDKEFAIQPYAHTDTENQVVSKSLLVFNVEQRNKVWAFTTDYIKNKL